MKSITRNAEADWKGNLDQGHGLVTSGSLALHKHPFSFNKRVDQGDKEATNPEELIAAALSSCFSMALAKTLQDEDVIPQELFVTTDVTLNITDDGPKVNEVKLDISGMIGGYTQEQLEKAVATTQENCPIYKLLAPGLDKIDITVSLRN